MTSSQLWPPPPPKMLRAEPVGPTQIRVAWEPPAGYGRDGDEPLKYVVSMQRILPVKESALFGDFNVVKRVSGVLEATVHDLEAGKPYQFKVCTRCSSARRAVARALDTMVLSSARQRSLFQVAAINEAGVGPYTDPTDVVHTEELPATVPMTRLTDAEAKVSHEEGRGSEEEDGEERDTAAKLATATKKSFGALSAFNGWIKRKYVVPVGARDQPRNLTRGVALQDVRVVRQAGGQVAVPRRRNQGAVRHACD